MHKGNDDAGNAKPLQIQTSFLCLLCLFVANTLQSFAPIK